MQTVKILSAATATNSAPTAATDGFEIQYGGLRASDDEVVVWIESTAGSGTMTVTVKLWVYSVLRANWAPLGTHATASSKGIINQGNAIGETSADKIMHTEIVTGFRHFDRVYAEITAIGGTSTAISGYLMGR